jgi:hypothetical protein
MHVNRAELSTKRSRESFWPRPGSRLLEGTLMATVTLGKESFETAVGKPGDLAD